jgi:hypothetical protein
MSLKYPKQPSSANKPPNFLLTHKTTIQVIRKSAGSYVNGLWVDATNTVSVQCHIQPLKGSELMALPEADRNREWIKAYTTDDVNGLVDGSGGVSPDVIVWDSKHYEVAKVLEYKMGVLNHTKIIAARVVHSAGYTE